MSTPLSSYASEIYLQGMGGVLPPFTTDACALEQAARDALEPGPFWYVAGSARYHQAYGSVAAFVLVLAWFLLSAFSVVLGAEINAELERQTRRDTTVGNEKPIGERGASAADDLGGSLS